jgi:hypothetical protein
MLLFQQVLLLFRLIAFQFRSLLSLIPHLVAKPEFLPIKLKLFQI